MEELFVQQKLVGREKELTDLSASMDCALKGQGQTCIITGEAGIGKTRLVNEFKAMGAENFVLLEGVADANSIEPFQIFSRALENVSDQPFFHNRVFSSFSSVFAVNRGGILIAHAAPQDSEMDADIFAGMLSAVQSFVKDSFDSDGTKKAGLGRLEYGDKKIIIEHGQHIFLTAVFDGAEHRDMVPLLKKTVNWIESEHDQLFEKWAGNMNEMEPVQKMIFSLADAKFLVKRELASISLDSERMKISENILQILEFKSAQSPLLLLLEDLHWSEDSSLFVLQYLARNIKDMKILILATARSNESEVFDSTLTKMQDEGIVQHQVLEMLDTANVSSLVSGLYENHLFPEKFINDMAKKCQGNPFFTIELVRQMEAEGSIGIQDGRFTLLDENYSIPDTVESLVHQKMERLDHYEFALVEYASCIGLKFDTKIISTAKLVPDVPGTIDKLISTGILRTSQDSYEFTHALYKETIYHSISKRWKSAHHHSIGEYYETEFSNDPNRVIYELARHFSNSLDYSKAYDYSIRAGERAESEFAPEESISFYQGAFFALERQPAQENNSELLRLLEEIGRLQILAAHWTEGIETFKKAKALHTEDVNKARMLIKIAEINENQGALDNGLKALEEAKSLVDDKKSKTYAKLLRQEACLLGAKGQREKALEDLHSSLVVFKELGLNLDIGIVLRNIGLQNMHLSNNKEAEKCYFESLKVMTELNDNFGIGHALNNLGVLYWRTSEMEKSLEYYQKSLELKERIGDAAGVASTLGNIGNNYYATGQPDKALEYLQKSLVMKRKTGDQWGTAASLLTIGVIYWIKGDLDMAHDKYSESLELWEAIDDEYGLTATLNNFGELNFYMGNYDAALKFYTRSRKLREESKDVRGLINTLLGLSQTYREQGKKDEAMDCTLRANELSNIDNSPQLLGKCQCHFGQIYHAFGDLEKAANHFEESVQILGEHDCVNDLVLTHFFYGNLCADMGKPEKAMELYNEAMEVFQKLGMKWWGKKCQAEMNKLNT